MIPGIVASQTEEAGAILGGDVLIDFVNGVYTVGATSYTLADAITQTALVSPGVGLVIPDQETSPGIQEILGPFLDRLLSPPFTLIIAVTGFSTAHNGNSVFLNVQNDDLSAGCQVFTTKGSGVYDIKVDDFDAIVGDNLIRSFSADYSAGAHKFGVTRNNFAFPIALAADGSLVDWFTDSDVPATPWTKANFGGDYINGVNGCRNGATIQSLRVIDPVALDDLAALTV